MEVPEELKMCRAALADGALRLRTAAVPAARRLWYVGGGGGGCRWKLLRLVCDIAAVRRGVGEVS